MLMRNSAAGTARFSLLPDFMAESVAGIDFACLKRHGVTACLIDLDGTVVVKSRYEVDPAIVRALQAAALPIYIATNRPKSRDLKNLRQDLGASGVIHPHKLVPKPFRYYYRSALAAHRLKPQEVVMIGDRLLQDVWGGNHAGLHTLLISPRVGGSKGWLRAPLSAVESWLIRRFMQHYQPAQ